MEDGDIISSNDRYSPQKIKVTIIGLTGKENSIYVYPCDKIRHGNAKCGQDFSGWKFDGEILNNDKTFAFYDIEDGDIIVSSYLIRG